MENILGAFRGIREIDPDEYGVNITGFPISEIESSLYDGSDSEGNRIALKVYRRHHVPIGITEIRRYQAITNKAKLFLDGKKVTLSKPDGSQDTYAWEVNGIDKIGKLKTSQDACTISKFIKGPTLLDEMESGRYVDRENIDALRKVSDQLNEVLGVKNILVLPLNVKIAGDKIIVTDLCAQLQKLENGKGGS